jgi:hypothetical protein
MFRDRFWCWVVRVIAIHTDLHVLSFLFGVIREKKKKDLSFMVLQVLTDN